MTLFTTHGNSFLSSFMRNPLKENSHPLVIFPLSTVYNSWVWAKQDSIHSDNHLKACLLSLSVTAYVRRAPAAT